MSRLPALSRIGALLIAWSIALSAALAAPAAAASRISNVATLHYAGRDGEQTIRSNEVSAEIVEIKRPTTLSFRQLPAGYRIEGLACQTVPTLMLTPGMVSPDQLAAAAPLKSLDIQNPLIVVLDADGENRDPARRDTAIINVNAGDRSSELLLTETDVDSGIFAGALPAGTDPAGRDDPCNLALTRSGKVNLNFTENTTSLSSIATLLIDPEGYVFDSRTGNLLDGAIVSLVNDATGQAATVFGDDGISAYPATVTSGGSVTDAGGHRYDFSKGNFRFPLAQPGSYRLVVTPPAGYAGPSSATREALATLPGPLHGPFQIIDGSFGGTFALASPEPVHLDVPLDPGGDRALVLDKAASVREASPGDFVQYRLRLTNPGKFIAKAAAISDVLPAGLRYRPDSARGAATAQIAADGRTLTLTAPDLAPGATAEIRYVAEVTPGAPVGEAVNRARVTGATTSNEASASVRLKALLFTDALTIIGRVTEGDCRGPARGRKGVPGIRLMLEDGTFVVTDRDGLYHIEGVRAGRHVVQMDLRSVPATHEPVACDMDTRQARSAISRFVEGGGGSLQRVDFQLRPTGKAADTTRDALPITVAEDAVAAGNREDWLAGQMPGIDWLFPAIDHNPRAPALRVVIKHGPGQRVALRLNGAPVDPLSFDGTDADEKTHVAISRWTGLPLKDRDNLLEARVLDPSGKVAATLTRTVHYANVPVRAVFVPEHSRLVADGLTKPLVAVRLTDREGRPVRAGTIVPFRVDPPYTAAVQAEAQMARQLAGLERAAATARVVGDEGLAFIALQPTTQAGAANVTVALTEDGREQVSEIKAWLAAATPKDWIVVGFGEGTAGYDVLSSKSRSAGRHHDVVTDGQLAFYAKGRVKGSWLLTIAYDSDRRYDRDRGLLGTIDPNRYYTVYGDGTQQTYDASTRRKLYLRLERREFYALFGDFETGLVDTQLTRYSRTMNGTKAAYQGRHVQFTAFAARSDQLYARDEIQGNGLSGPYRLSARDIVPNSDKLRIETRDRFRSEKIVDTRSLTRHIDYDIDSSAGTIRFREPILSRDAGLNPIFIVVDYETSGGRTNKLAAGGRASARMAGGRLEVGASVLRDETVAIATVAGIDLKARPTRNTEARLEAASGGSGGVGRGRAYIAEVEHHGGRADVLAYARQQDGDFGLGQQNRVESGTRKLGMDGRLRLTDRIGLSGSGWHQQNLTGPGVRSAGEARLEYRRDNGILFVGGQFASDTGVSGEKTDSRLLTLGGTQSFLRNRLEIGGQTQFAIGGQDSSVDFPVRRQITASYEVKKGIRLIAGHEIAEGDKYTAHSTRLGFDVAPWTGAKLLATANQQAIGENGARTFAQYGLSQSLPIGKRWTIDATVDASSTVKGAIPVGAVVNPFHPVASGGFLGQDQTNGDYSSATLGATFRADRWTWNGRVEARRSDASDRWGVTSNLLRTLGEGKTVSSSLRAYRLRNADGAVASFASADLAVALRPLDSRWSLLERLELRHERADAGVGAGNALGVGSLTGGDQITTRVINNLAVNYRSGSEGVGHGFEASIYYGAKYVSGKFDDDTYDGFIDVVGVQLRRDIGRRFDIGIDASLQHAWKTNSKAFSIGPSIGVSPAENVWMTIGYNVTGYRDPDFQEARYTRRGAYATMRLKFDQFSIGRGMRAVGRAAR